MISASTRFLAQPSEIKPTRRGFVPGIFLSQENQTYAKRRAVVENYLPAELVAGELVDDDKTAGAMALVETVWGGALVSASIPSCVRSTARAAKGSPFCGSRSWFSTVFLRSFNGGSVGADLRSHLGLVMVINFLGEQLETGGAVVLADGQIVIRLRKQSLTAAVTRSCDVSPNSMCMRATAYSSSVRFRGNEFESFSKRVLSGIFLAEVFYTIWRLQPRGCLRKGNKWRRAKNSGGHWRCCCWMPGSSFMKNR